MGGENEILPVRVDTLVSTLDQAARPERPQRTERAQKKKNEKRKLENPRSQILGQPESFSLNQLPVARLQSIRLSFRIDMLTAAAFISTTLSTTTSCSSSFQIINQGIANAETSIGPVDGLLTSSACCARCMSTPECIAWTWHVSPPHTCWLTAHPDVPHGAAGTVVSGIPKPAPTAPPTAAPTHILPQPALAPPLGYRPNVIFILTDDQDYMQHSMEAMPATRALFSDAQSFNMSRAYVATPICCPSRASYLTGMHTHNHGTLQNSGARGCSSAEFVATKEEKAYPAYLKTAGYTTGFFGKYLNTYGTANPGGLSHIPRGWDHWEGLKGNSKYYNYSVSINGVPEVHHDDYATDYYTDLLANRSSAWLNAHLQSATSAPALLVVHTPAPHRPATPAPQFANSFSNHTAPRTPSWNHVSSSGPSGGGKHKWLSTLPSMNATTIEYSDHVWRRRLRALQSVDELVTKIHGIVEAHGAMERTVWIYTSDHGYHSGQFGVTHCKMLRTLRAQRRASLLCVCVCSFSSHSPLSPFFVHFCLVYV